MCPTNGDESAIHACLAGHADGIVAALMGGGTCGSGGLPRTGRRTAPDLRAREARRARTARFRPDARSYTDNGDGTITDNVTGLMWEKLSDDGSVHDWNDAYTWSDAFNVKIAALNSAGGFAGYTDWRLPNVFELQSIVDYGQPTFAIPVGPLFQTGCIPSCTVITGSCTSFGYTWSSTSQPALFGAFAVDFFSGTGDTATQPRAPLTSYAPSAAACELLPPTVSQVSTRQQPVAIGVAPAPAGKLSLHATLYHGSWRAGGHTAAEFEPAAQRPADDDHGRLPRWSRRYTVLDPAPRHHTGSLLPMP